MGTKNFGGHFLSVLGKSVLGLGFFLFSWPWPRLHLCFLDFGIIARASSDWASRVNYNNQRWSRGHKARGQGQGHKKNPRPRPRTAFPRTDTLEAKDRNARGQGQGPRTQSASALQKKKKGLHKNFSGDLPKKKKRSSQKFFRRSPKKKKKKKRSSQKFFKRSPLKYVFQKIFQALHKILTFQNIVLSSSRGQANFRGLEASRPKPRTSKCVLEDVLEAKDVLEDSTSDNNNNNQH